jgi:hypothetical protein
MYKGGNRPSEQPSGTSIDCCLSGPQSAGCTETLQTEDSPALSRRFLGVRRWKSRSCRGRLEIRQLICAISIANAVSGAIRIRGELLKLGTDAGQSAVAK